MSGSTGPHQGAYRPAAIGRNGVVAAAHGLAATAGLRVLFQGGTAVDAAVAVGAALGIVEPYMSGIGGGGGFMLIYEAATRSVHALDYLGSTPASANPQAFSHREDLDSDVRASTVPSLLAGWLEAHARFGRLDRAQVFQPAIDLAEHGWPVSTWAAGIFKNYSARLKRHMGSSASAGGLLRDGQPPSAGDIVSQPDLAHSYRQIVDGGADVFYRGELGGRLIAAINAAGGWLTESDLATCAAHWRTPLVTDYRGWQIHSSPPPSSGFQYLECLRLLESSDLHLLGHNSADYLHLVIEAIKLASADRTAYAAADLTTIHALFSPAYAAYRSTSIDRSRAAASEGERYVAHKSDEVQPGVFGLVAAEHTTHFETADRWGNLVAVTQSNGAPFGSGFVAGDTGVVMNNFLYWTDLDPSSPNYLRGGQTQPEIPMAPCIVTRDGRLELGIGTPGSYGILQTTLQMVLNALDFGMPIQAAIEAPRVRAFERFRVDVEGRVEPDVVAGLRGRGHDIHVLEPWTWAVGGGHGIRVDSRTGALHGGADPRRDGQAVAY